MAQSLHTVLVYKDLLLNYILASVPWYFDLSPISTWDQPPKSFVKYPKGSMRLVYLPTLVDPLIHGSYGIVELSGMVMALGNMIRDFVKVPRLVKLHPEIVSLHVSKGWKSSSTTSTCNQPLENSLNSLNLRFQVAQKGINITIGLGAVVMMSWYHATWWGSR